MYVCTLYLLAGHRSVLIQPCILLYYKYNTYVCMSVVGYLARKHVGQVKQGTISKANCNCQAYLTCNSYRTLFQK